LCKIIPLDLQIKQALHAEAAAFTPADPEWTGRATASCAAFLVSSQLAGSSLALVASKSPLKNPTCKSLIAPLLGIITVAIIAAVSFASVQAASNTEYTPPESPAPAQMEAIMNIDTEIYAEGEILFSGSDTAWEQVNPREVTMWARNEYGELPPLCWWIIDIRNEEVLYQGKGGAVDGTFQQMRNEGKTGNYMLHFSLEDKNGNNHILSRRFTLTGP